MTTVVDFHVHAFPDNLEPWVRKIPKGLTSGGDPFEKVQKLRRKVRGWIKPFSNSIHGIQPQLRYLPEMARKNLDQLGGLAPLPGLFVESTLADLNEAMAEAGVHYAVVIAHPPFTSNEFVLEAYEQDPRMIPVVNIPKGTSKPGNLLKKYAAKGAKVLKIHASCDGEGVDSARYRALVRTASDLGLPVILHTGCMNAHVFYKDPLQGHAEKFTKWYETYPNTQFILAHMNFHEPNKALDVCEEFENVWVDTSWQPSEVIGEAVRRIGAERVLFGTDWPLVGNNMTVGRGRIQDCLETGMLNAEQVKLILGENAVKLLGLKQDAH